MLPNSGHLRITVTPTQATVDYVSSATSSNGTINYSYTIDPHISGPTHVLTTAVSPTEGGTINPSAGTHTYSEGAVFAVTATPNTGYTFTSWGGACSGSGSCSVTMDADKTVTANFTAVPTYVLTTAVNPSGGGTISPSAGAHTYNQGAVVPVTATPNSGYIFSSWSGACTGSGACSVTMNANKTVTANFTLQGGSVVSAATPSNATPSIGQQVVVSININMSGASAPDNKLGSFTGSLAWNPAILTYSSSSGLRLVSPALSIPPVLGLEVLPSTGLIQPAPRAITSFSPSRSPWWERGPAPSIWNTRSCLPLLPTSRVFCQTSRSRMVRLGSVLRLWVMSMVMGW